MVKTFFYNEKTGHSNARGNVKIDDRKAQRVITGDEVTYNAKTGYSEGHGNVKIVDKLKTTHCHWSRP